MKTSKKTKLISIILSAAACLALVFGITFGCLYKSPTPQEDGFSDTAKTQPDDTTKYWDESDEIQALITAGKTENQWQGSGTETDPYQISSALDLAWLSYRVYSGTGIKTTSGSLNYFYSGKYFKQTTDIDVSKYWWQPIGIYYDRSGTSTKRYFSGNYDGDGHTISGIFTKTGTTYAYYYQGLFGYAIGSSSSLLASIKNILVKDSIIQGKENIGGIIGAGYSYLTVEGCCNEASISGGQGTGGILGRASGATAKNCYNKGVITGSSTYVGGISGICGSSAIVTNCYNIGNVTNSSAYTGGIVGGAINAYTLKNCFNLASLYPVTAGGVAGNGSAATISNSYYGGNCTSDKGLYLGTDSATKSDTLTTDAKTLSWYQDTTKWDSTNPWDFDTVWELDPDINDGYPSLQWQKGYTYEGSGTEASPYLIDSEKALRLMAENVNSGVDRTAYFKQTANIRLTSGWTPISSFGGTYDGDGYTISGMVINSTDPDAEIGLFESASNLLNIHIRDSLITGVCLNAGSIAGSASHVENCSSDAVIKTGEGRSAGGLIGDGTEVINSIFKGKVTSSSIGVGGIVGCSRQSIENCENYGKIISNGKESFAGGIAGWMIHRTRESTSLLTTRIYGCKSYGTVKGVDFAGSIVGRTEDSEVEKCAGFGMVYCTKAEYGGGIIGLSGGTAVDTITNCSFLGSSNQEIGLFYCSYEYSGTPTLTSCYAQVNNTKGRSDGDFNSWSIVNDINNNLPIQNTLYSVANWSNRGSEIIAKLEELGFTKVA